MRNRLIGIGLGLLIGIVFLVWQSRAREIRPWDILPENEGTIRTIAFQYTMESEPYTMPCIRSFLSQIDLKTGIIAVCGSKKDADSLRSVLDSWQLTAPDRVKILVAGRQITGWCKDRFLVAREKDCSLLLMPQTEPDKTALRKGDSIVGSTIARSSSGRFAAIHTPLRFDAGDILATKSHVIVSDTLWRKNGCPTDFEETLRRMFNRKVVWLHDVPDHHIGMYAAPLDDQTMIVGDPGQAEAFWDLPRYQELGEADFTPRIIALFDRAAKQLREAGFRVVRIPLAYLGPQTYVTYTNGIFETQGDKRIVYMPWYDVSEMDEIARETYEQEGWEVRPVSVRTVYKFRGTIGCLVNVLERAYCCPDI